jgi:hypothetical protein
MLLHIPLPTEAVLKFSGGSWPSCQVQDPVLRAASGAQSVDQGGQDSNEDRGEEGVEETAGGWALGSGCKSSIWCGSGL